jgi:hypothetical protein
VHKVRLEGRVAALRSGVFQDFQRPRAAARPRTGACTRKHSRSSGGA